MTSRHRTLVITPVLVALVATRLAAGPLLSAAADDGPQGWPMHHFDSAQDGFNPDERGITRENVSSLQVRSTVDLATPYAADAPVIAQGVMYVTGYGLQQPETLYAFPAACKSEAIASENGCRPLWKAAVGFNSQPMLAADEGMVFVGSNNGPGTQGRARLWAFPAACGTSAAVCSPAWTYDFPTNYPIDTSPTVADGRVYVSAGFGRGAALYAFDVDCGASACGPRWKAPISVASLASPAVADGIVYVTDYGEVRAFATDCGTGGAVCQPLWTGVVGITGPPAVAGGEVFVSGGGFVWAFPARCKRSPCRPLWWGGGSSDGSSGVAIADDLVFMASNDGKLFSFPLHCQVSSRQGRCEPRWMAVLNNGHIYTRFSSPAVVNGVLFVTWTSNVKPWIGAFSTTGDQKRAGASQELWRGTAGYYQFTGPAIVDGNVYLSGGPINGPGQVIVFASE